MIPINARLCAVLVAAAFAAGCASTHGIAPQARPVAPAALGLQPASAVQWPAERWWADLGDAGLDALVQAALRDSPSLKAAQARLERAQAVAEAADAARRPRVDGAIESTRQRYTATGLYPPPIAGSIRTFSAAQATASWELDLFGRNRAALEAAIGAARAAEADAQAARVLLATNVTRTWLQLARLLEQRRVALQTRAQREQIVSLVRQRMSAGLDTRVELRQAEGSVPQIAQEIEALDEQVALTRHALAALLGQGPQAAESLEPQLSTVRLQPLPQSLPADLVGRRADLVAARWRVEAAARDIDVARAQFYPNINLTAFVGLQSLVLSRWLEADSQAWGVGPAIRLPIFDAGRLRANLAGRAADYDAAVQNWNATLVDAVREVADQVASLRSIERQATEQRAAQAAAEEALELATRRYSAGLGTYLNVLTAESAVLAQRRIGVDLRARALDANVALVRALGGGFSAGVPLAAPAVAAGAAATPPAVTPPAVTPPAATPPVANPQAANPQAAAAIAAR